MKLLIINQPLNNRGDEAAHKAFVRTLLNIIPEAYITVLFVQSYSPDAIRQFRVKHDRVVYFDLHPQGNFWQLAEKWINEGNFSDWATSPDMQTMRNFYEAADFVICAPGGICMGAFQDWWHLFYLKFAQCLNKPLIYYGRSFGPFPTDTEQNVRFKEESLKILRYFSFISIRDKKTEEIAAQIGNLHYFPTTDVAFLECPHVVVPKEVINKIGAKPYMVFIPNYLLWHPMYKGKVEKEAIIDFYCEIIDAIEQQYPKHNIVMLPQTFGTGTYDGDDVFFFREIADIKDDKRLIVVPDIYSSDIQQSIIASSQFVIGARYHSIVFALNQNVPFIALNYEHKIQGLLTALHKQECMVNIQNIFDCQQDIRMALTKVKELLPVIGNDERAHQQAYDEAWCCIRQLKSYLHFCSKDKGLMNKTQFLQP